MNFEEIKEKLKNLGIENHLFGLNCVGDWEGTNGETIKDIFGEMVLVEDVGGCEGSGEDCNVVWYFKDHDVYIRWDGWYASYDGAHYEEDGYEVKPMKQLVTNYVSISEPEDEALKNELKENARKVAIAFLDDLRNYERENGVFLAEDDRTSEEFFEIYLENE